MFTPGKYRPIIYSEILLNVFEKCINKRLLKIMKT